MMYDQLVRMELDRRRFLARAMGAAVTAGGVSGLLSACGGGSSTSGAAASAAKPPARPTGVLNSAIVTDFVTLDPSSAGTEQDLAVVTNVYEGLLKFDAKFEQLVPVLATSYEQSSDGREWTFHLRQGVRFHDGAPFDSEAVKATFAYYKSDPTFLAFLLLPDKFETDTSDPYVVRFKLSQPYPDFGRNQSFLRIISPKLIKQGKKAVAKRPTGTGPYRFGKIVPGQYTTLPANTEHWGTGPYFAELRLPLVSQLSARVAALSTGQIDVVNRLAPPQAAQFAGNHDVSLPTTGPSWAQGYFLFKVNNVNVRDLAVRQAVAWGLDR